MTTLQRFENQKEKLLSTLSFYAQSSFPASPSLLPSFLPQPSIFEGKKLYCFHFLTAYSCYIHCGMICSLMLALRGHNDLLVDHLMVLFLLCFCMTSVILPCPPSLQILVQLPFLLFFSMFRGSLCVSPWIFPLFAFSLSYFFQQFHLKKKKKKYLQPLYLFRGFPGSAVVKKLPANAEDAKDSGSIPGSGRSPGGGNGNLLQYSCLKKLHRQRILASYSAGSFKELDMTEHTHIVSS